MSQQQTPRGKPAPKTVTTVDLVDENNKLRKASYLERRQSAGRLLTLLLISLGCNGFLGWLAFFHFPVSQFAWTSNAGAVCEAMPIDEPHVGQEIVADSAVQATVGIYSYDYQNYLRQITGVANREFTPEFRDKFIPLFADSQNLKTVIENFYVVSASENPKRPAQIARVGKRGGVYFWDVLVPVNVYYSSGRKIQMEKILATVTVVRVSPTRMNPRGIAVDNINTAPLAD